MAVCSFCGDRIPKGRGKMFVKDSGKILYFCSSKCEKNMNLGRKPFKVRWTRLGRRMRGKTT
ncbi:MAG: 50S ribosomal protein L24e [Candidatus Aenigmatarchaeota archaeon]|nr:MAG: 50S ribosomal protein L24e [Candidatus Aenigmarchaeota archaeon]